MTDNFASPPDEIAELFDTVEIYLGDTENWELADDSTPDPTDAADSLHKLRATLRALMVERDNLKAEFAVAVKWHEQDAADYNELRDERDFFDGECQEHAATIAACVAERDEWKMKYESEVRLVDSIEAERDAIRAKTIEDASETLLNKRDSLPNGHKNRLGLELAASIVRALAQTDESNG